MTVDTDIDGRRFWEGVFRDQLTPKLGPAAAATLADGSLSAWRERWDPALVCSCGDERDPQCPRHGDGTTVRPQVHL